MISLRGMFKRRGRNAAQWFLRTKSDRATPRDDRKLTRWLSQGTHESDYQLMELVWQLSGELKGDRSVDYLSRRVSPAATRSGILRARSLVIAGIAALIVLSIGLPVLLPRSATYATGIAEQRRVELWDHSRLLLNTASSVRIEYSLRHRHIVLESGEATFEVAKNRWRPFEVTTSKGSATALGTRFDVFVRPTSMEVAIVEGTVAVRSAQDTSAQNMAIVRTGQLATVTAQHKIVIGVADLTPILNAQVERLEFDNVPITDAIAEFNLYSRKPVRAATEEISARRISGVFHASDTATFANSLAASLRLRVEDTAEAVVLVKRDTQPRTEHDR